MSRERSKLLPNRSLLLLLLLANSIRSITASLWKQKQPTKVQRPRIDTRNLVKDFFLPHDQLRRHLETVITPIPHDAFNRQDAQASNDTIKPTTTSTCSLCGADPIRASLVPITFTPAIPGMPANTTCAEWDAMTQTLPSVCPGIQSLYYKQCCIYNTPIYECENNIHEELFGPESRYNPAVPPIVSSAEPVKVTVRLILQQVREVDVQNGSGEMLISLLLTWKDPRLQWNLDANHCTSYIGAWAASVDPQNTNIWVPDFDLYNKIEGIQEFPDIMARVYNDGTVVWRTNGSLKVICQFTGLAKIPFDTLGCQLLMGPFVRGDPMEIQYILWNETGLEFGDFKSTYNEYLPLPELFESGSANGYVLFFNFYFKRAKSYYVFNLIVSDRVD